MTPPDDAPPPGTSPGGAGPIDTDAKTVVRASGEFAPVGGMSAEPVLAEGTRIGRYVITARVGAGGMGEVYVASDPQLDRKVALKLVRADARTDPQVARERMSREAQALARLSHPNVVAVHDVGVHQDQVFIAMDLVEGALLSEWLAAAPRSWREIRRVFLEAGAGLEAAHRVGLVHRDFKPSNVLVTASGRAVVIDFGLARAAEATPRGEPSAHPGSLSSALTQYGAILGTPGYMSPEQLRAEATDARTDQFSFCVAMYEALHGERVFRSDTLHRMLLEAEQGLVRELPRRKGVPRRFARLLRRGLSARPEDRYPSMAALLAELGRDVEGQRLRLGATVTVLMLVVTTAVGAHRAAQQQSFCGGGEVRFATAWSAERASRIHQAFRATRMPYAEDAFAAARAVLDPFAGAWVAMYREACEATRVRATQSEELLDRRMACLDRRREEVAALVSVLETADAQVTAQAPLSVLAIPPLEGCADAEALLATVAPPPGAPERAEVAAIRGALANARALRDTGQFKQALAAVAQPLERARSLGYGPVLAEALLLAGEASVDAGQFAEAGAHYEPALWTALGARDDAVAARVAVALVELSTRRSYAEGYVWEPRAEALVGRLRQGEALRALLLLAGATVRYWDGKPTEAIARVEEGLRLHAQHRLDPFLRLRLTTVQGMALTDAGRLAEAGLARRSALEQSTQLLGAQHPRTGYMWNNLANQYTDEGRFSQAREAYQRALDILLPTVGDQHPNLATILINLGRIEMTLGRPKQGIAPVLRGLVLREAAFGPHHADVGRGYLILSALYLDLGRTAEARGALDRALEIHRKALGETNFEFGEAVATLASLEAREGNPTLALATADRAIRITSLERGPESALVASAWQVKASVLIAIGRAAEAVEPLRRAHAAFGREYGAGHWTTHAAARDLARALLETGDLQGAEPLARAAAEARLESPREDALARALLARIELSRGAGGAVERLRAALADLEREGEVGPAAEIGEARFALARGVHPIDAPGARKLAARALEEARALRDPRQAARIEAWLRSAR